MMPQAGRLAVEVWGLAREGPISLLPDSPDFGHECLPGTVR